MRKKVIHKIIMELCLVSLVIVILIHTNHNLNKRILSLFLCIDITSIFATRHQLINDTLIFLAIRIIYNMIDNLAIADNTKRPEDNEDRNLRSNERCINANDAPHMI